MKEIYKNPTLYYIVVPVMIALWPLIIGAVHLPDAQRSLKDELGDYKTARSRVAEILTLDPDRLDFGGSKKGAAEFTYYDAVDKVADLCKIPPANCQITSKPMSTSKKKGPKSQDCLVVLRDVDVATFAKFLSTIQLRWASLTCVNATLIKNKGLPDKWKVNLNFKYYYKRGE